MYGFIVIGITNILNTLNVSKRKIKGISTIFIIFFMGLANFVPSVVRACIMTIVALLARYFL